MDFTNWAPNEPKLGETADCCRLKNDFSMFGMWRDGVCTDNCPYICKKLKSKILLYNVFRNRSLKRSQESILVSRFARIHSWQQICKNPRWFLNKNIYRNQFKGFLQSSTNFYPCSLKQTCCIAYAYCHVFCIHVKCQRSSMKKA